MASWLITGGCGFIGSALIPRLLAAGEKVRVVDNLSVGTVEALPRPPVRLTPAQCGSEWSGLELVVTDIRDAQAAVAACAGADIIVHLAANTGVAPSVENPRMDAEVNIFGTLNYLEAARANGTGRFVLASSGAPLAGNEPPLTETMAPRPLSPYGASKLAGEGYLSAYHGSFGVAGVALRFGNVYGPGSAHKESVVARFIKRALAGEVLEIYGDGQQTRDFVYIEDLVEAIHRAATVPGIGGEVFQIATNRESTVQEITDMVAAVVGERTGRPVQVRHGEERVGDARRNFSDVSKARRLLGYSPETDLRAGIARTLDYFLSTRTS